VEQEFYLGLVLLIDFHYLVDKVVYGIYNKTFLTQHWIEQLVYFVLIIDQDVPCSVGLHPTLGVEKPGLVCSEPLRGTDVWGADCYFHPLSTSNLFFSQRKCSKIREFFIKKSETFWKSLVSYKPVPRKEARKWLFRCFQRMKLQ